LLYSVILHKLTVQQVLGRCVIPLYKLTPVCSVSLVESIPENLTYPAGAPTHSSTYSAWKDLISLANQSIEIASMYWTMRNKETGTTSPTAQQVLNYL